MAFSDYKTIAQVQQKYGIRYQEGDFLTVVEAQLSEQFVQEFQFNVQNLDVFSSEAARCELLILPILREAYKKYAERLSLWVQKPLNYDAALSGTPDYMLSKRSSLGKTVLEYPLLMVAEAKKNDFEQGWGQCLAELIAGQRLNGAEQAIYGVVTDGRYWEFGKLERQLLTRSLSTFSIDNLAVLFGALDEVFGQFERVAV